MTRTVIDALIEEIEEHLDPIYPKTVFIGCYDCTHKPYCDCDSGVRTIRRIRDIIEILKNDQISYHHVNQ
jgi:hypothetical protein